MNEEFIDNQYIKVGKVVTLPTFYIHYFTLQSFLKRTERISHTKSREL
jgi:hypothetical protein